jgi:hypothetical protein
VPFVTLLVAGGALVLSSAPALASPVSLAAKTTVASSSADPCANVSASAVSAIVGYSAPAPTAPLSDTLVVDKALNLTATVTDCSFTSAITPTNFSPKSVVLSYEVFNKPVSLALLKTIEASEQEKLAAQEKATDFTATEVPYSGLGVTAFYFTITAKLDLGLPKGIPMPKGVPTSLAYEGISTLQGTKSFGSAVNNTTLAKGKLADLTRLAMKI